jgi:hypothetical protein
MGCPVDTMNHMNMRRVPEADVGSAVSSWNIGLRSSCRRMATCCRKHTLRAVTTERKWMSSKHFCYHDCASERRGGKSAGTKFAPFPNTDHSLPTLHPRYDQKRRALNVVCIFRARRREKCLNANDVGKVRRMTLISMTLALLSQNDFALQFVAFERIMCGTATLVSLRPRSEYRSIRYLIHVCGPFTGSRRRDVNAGAGS